MALPEMVPVTRSSTVEAVGYDPAAYLLVVRFKGGAQYEYEHVQPIIHQRMMAAPSIGSFFAANIKAKPTSYPCTKLDGKPKPAAPFASLGQLDTGILSCIETANYLITIANVDDRGVSYVVTDKQDGMAEEDPCFLDDALALVAELEARRLNDAIAADLNEDSVT